MSEHKHECDCELVAQQAVREVFLKFGVDVDDHKEVEDFRENLRMSKTIGKVIDKSIITIIGLIVTVAFYSIWDRLFGTHRS